MEHLEWLDKKMESVWSVDQCDRCRIKNLLFHQVNCDEFFLLNFNFEYAERKFVQFVYFCFDQFVTRKCYFRSMNEFLLFLKKLSWFFFKRFRYNVFLKLFYFFVLPCVSILIFYSEWNHIPTRQCPWYLIKYWFFLIVSGCFFFFK